MANKTAEELFAEGCSHLRYSHHKYDDTKCYEATTENDFIATQPTNPVGKLYGC